MLTKGKLNFLDESDYEVCDDGQCSLKAFVASEQGSWGSGSVPFELGNSTQQQIHFAA